MILFIKSLAKYFKYEKPNIYYLLKVLFIQLLKKSIPCDISISGNPILCCISVSVKSYFMF